MPTISSDKRKKDLKCTGWINIKISGKKIAIFQNLTYQLQTQFSQLPNGQNAKFQCLSDAEFPEFFRQVIISSLFDAYCVLLCLPEFGD